MLASRSIAIKLYLILYVVCKTINNYKMLIFGLFKGFSMSHNKHCAT